MSREMIIFIQKGNSIRDQIMFGLLATEPMSYGEMTTSNLRETSPRGRMPHGLQEKDQLLSREMIIFIQKENSTRDRIKFGLLATEQM